MPRHLRIEGSRARLRVLIADDYPDLTESLSLFISLAGYETQVAHDGEAALNLALAWPPDVCILDIHMPKVDGWDVARCLRQLTFGDRVVLIALTGCTSAADRHRAYQVGFDYFVRKVLDPEHLVQLIDSATGSVRGPVLAARTVQGLTASL